MKLFFSRALLAVALAVVLFSCGGGDDEGPVSASPTFLKVGTAYTFYYDDGFFFADTVRTIVDKQLATDTFLIRHDSESIDVAGTQYWVLKGNDLYTSLRLRDPSMYVLECRFGQPVGTTWEATRNGTAYTYTIDALNVAIKTNDGVVNDAIRIKIKTAGGQDTFQYLSPTVGLLGNGSVDEDVTMKPVHYTIGTTDPVNSPLPAITYGSFPFLTVGKYWEYLENNLISEVEVTLLVESKLPDRNIYKVKLTYNGTPEYQYWFEDNGVLMVYEEGEAPRNADPLYMKDNVAAVRYGWAGITSSGTTFFYRITAMNETADSYFGELPCTVVSVSDGLFSSQNNYWNANKGNILVTGFVSRDVTDSNARKNLKRPFIPVLGY